MSDDPSAQPRKPARKQATPAELRPADPALSDVKFLTVAEVASVMRVSKMTVYRMVHAGELPAVRVGRSFRVPEKAVHDYLRDAFIEAG
ncbi:helix-turn-helix domain-containing protein [uncultured Jatrophihabitans sp.]|uniref:helix-turn-helix domain-containing protein n=1 Tax=uncultured Jatrophihabitans sp. TaxID=1610747 RepID=UPI0035CC40D4